IAHRTDQILDDRLLVFHIAEKLRSESPLPGIRRIAQHLTQHREGAFGETEEAFLNRSRRRVVEERVTLRIVLFEVTALQRPYERDVERRACRNDIGGQAGAPTG